MNSRTVTIIGLIVTTAAWLWLRDPIPRTFVASWGGVIIVVGLLMNAYAWLAPRLDGPARSNIVELYPALDDYDAPTHRPAA